MAATSSNRVRLAAAQLRADADCQIAHAIFAGLINTTADIMLADIRLESPRVGTPKIEGDKIILPAIAMNISVPAPRLSDAERRRVVGRLVVESLEAEKARSFRLERGRKRRERVYQTDNLKALTVLHIDALIRGRLSFMAAKL